MLITEMILVALQSVRANLFRAFLTMLGIIIGVASVITMIAIGSGAKAAVDEQIDALGASVLSIRAGSFMRMGVAQSGAVLTSTTPRQLPRAHHPSAQSSRKLPANRKSSSVIAMKACGWPESAQTLLP